MSLSKKPYKGCRDFFPKEMRIREFLFQHMRSSAEKYSFEPYDGPLLEEVELYKAKSGEELINDQIYSFTDRGKREVAIRPEMTPTLARMVASVHRELPKPIRWYSIPNLMRYEKPQRGRVREHWQFNVDIFGSPKNLGELEILSLAVSFLTGLGATKEMFTIYINDRTIVDHIFNDLLKLDAENSYKLYKVIDKAKKVTPEKLETMIDEIISDTETKKIFKEYLSLESFEQVKIFLTEKNMLESCQDFLSFISFTQELSLSEFINYDPTIVRGLDYYTGIVFEVFDKHPQNNRAIAGGGAYGNLLQIFNEPAMAGVGFGLGDVTLKDFLETHGLLKDFSHAENDLAIFYTNDKDQMEAFKLAESLRMEGLKVELNLGQLKFGKIFKVAEKKGHEKLIVVEERDNKTTLSLKTVGTKEDHTFSLQETKQLKDILIKE